MFKKVEVWIVYLVSLLNLAFTVFFGVLVRQELVGTQKLGFISKAALFVVEVPVNYKRLFLGDQIVNKDRFPNLNKFNGSPNSKESYLLLSKWDGDLKEGIIQLVDLTNFSILHTWNPDINKFNNAVEGDGNEFKFLKRDDHNGRKLLHHPKLLGDGGLLFGWNSPLRKIDYCSNLVYQLDDNYYHHSIETDIEGNIWVPSNIYPQTLPSQKVGRNIPYTSKGFLDDSIVKISPNGKVLYRKSISQIFIDNDLEYLLFSAGKLGTFIENPIHLNDIQPVNFDGKYWEKGDLFLSLKAQSMVFLYRPSTNKIIWTSTGPHYYQHDVNILNDHQISVFNNNAKQYFSGEVVDGNNEVLIYDFKLDKYTSYLEDKLKKYDLKAVVGGRSKILSNGDLFVEESRQGRILYINADGSLKWSYVNRANNKNVYTLGWSRILTEKEDIKIVKNFLKMKGDCK